MSNKLKTISLILLSIVLGAVIMYFLNTKILVNKVLENELSVPKATSMINVDFSNWKDYKNDDLGISFKYPGDLIEKKFKEETGLKGTYYNIAFNGDVYTGMSISGESEDFKLEMYQEDEDDYKNIDFTKRIKNKKSNEVIYPIVTEDAAHTTTGLFILRRVQAQSLNGIAFDLEYITKLKRSKYKTAVFKFYRLSPTTIEDIINSVKVY